MTADRQSISKIYTLYIDDDRYSVPSLDAIDAGDDDAATELARARLASSPHYLAIELWDGERQIARLESPARRVSALKTGRIEPRL
ncbi:MAG TPA: hypothetical protein VKT30_17060 [Caulobacteraceae bacterium]|nr:hypothetical protein [Caulobacteraceae bacterium]